MRKTLTLLSLLLAALLLHAQDRQPVVQLSSPAPDMQAFTHVTLVLAPGSVIPDATVVVRDGVIAAAGAQVRVPAGAQVHDLAGRWMYPGLIDASSDYTLKAEAPAAVRGFRQGPPQYGRATPGPYYWNEAVKPEAGSGEAFAPNAEQAAALRKLGFTAANILPADGILRGSGALALLGEGPAAGELVLPQSSAVFAFRKGSSRQSYPNSLMGTIALIRQVLLDADAYRKAWAAFKAQPDQPAPDRNLSLEALNAHLDAKLPLIFHSEGVLNSLRAGQIAKEFGLSFIYLTSGDEYKYLDEFKALNAPAIVPLAFPDAYEVQDPGDARDVTLTQLRAWELAPANPAMLAKAGVRFALTPAGLKQKDQFWTRLRKALSYGLTETEALAALTTTPAALLGVSAQMGTLDPGKRANFFVASGNIFSEGSTVEAVYVGGKRYDAAPVPDTEVRGTWEWNAGGQAFSLKLDGKPLDLKPSVRIGGDSSWTASVRRSGDQLQLTFTQQAKQPAYYRLSAAVSGSQMSGYGEDPNGQRFAFTAARTAPLKPAAAKADSAAAVSLASLGAIPKPFASFGAAALPAQEAFVVRNATVWTNTKDGILTEADVLVESGKIKAVGKDLRTAAGMKEIDGAGKHLTTGIIDEHTHVAITQGVNEASHAVTAEVRIGDVLDPEDIDIYRQLAGGVTAAQVLHGSANPIGGQSAIIKFRWGASAEGLKFEGAPGFIKFALGENVKQSNAGDFATIRYPQSRMGVEQLIQDAFRSAKDYRAAWQRWEREGKARNLAPPARDLQLETLLEILDGKRFITCHSYVQSEITMLIRLAEAEGFKVNTFTHILEGYKVADKMKAHGANASSFADWWAYKVEVAEAIPYSPALMQQVGLNVCINSDDAEMARRLNQEAAKAVKYGGVSEEEAWKMVTLNPAKALHIDHRVGSIAAGKDADLVLWNSHPLSIYAKPLHTWVDGRMYFDLERDQQLRDAQAAERNRLITKMMQSAGDRQAPGRGNRPPRNYHCDDVEEDFSGAHED